MNWYAFLSFMIVAIFTPGPNNLTSFATAGEFGWRAVRPFVTGVCAGFFAVFVTAGAANLVLSHLLPSLTRWLPPIGFAYLIYLAWMILRGGRKTAGRRSEAVGFFFGLGLQVVNVKVVMNALTAMSGFVIPAGRSFWFVVAVSALCTGLAFASNMLWALCGAALQRVLNRWNLTFRIVMAGLLVWCGLVMLQNVPLSFFHM